MVGFSPMRTTARIKGHAGLEGDKQSYQEAKKPGRRLLGTHPSFHRGVINPSSIFSDGTASRGLFGGRLAVNRCTQDDNQHTHHEQTPRARVIGA